MAYGVKYRFEFAPACCGTGGSYYRVDLLEDGYSGTVTKRPLGKAPIIRMQDAGCIRATSCDLVLECQVEGEFVDLYTTNPFQYKVEVYLAEGVSSWYIWRGYVATEIYSEPDIAPPYDVRITATDGLGVLKEYDFEASGAMSIREHICAFLNKAGDAAPMFYYATMLSEFQSTTPVFMDDAKIDLDYMAGENCYDVLKYLLDSLRSVLLYRGSHWLIVREVDAQIDSSGMLSVVQCITADPYYTPYSTTVKMGNSVGKMGVADMWPVGYLTRRVVPAKRSVTVEAPWHPLNGAPSVQDDQWDGSGGTHYYTGASFVSVGDGNSYYQFGTSGGYNFTDQIFAEIPVENFKLTMNVKIRASLAPGQTANGTIGMDVGFYPSGSSSFIAYCGPQFGWGAYASTDSDIQKQTVDVQTDLSSDAQEVTFSIPPPTGYTAGTVRIYILGKGIRVFDVVADQNLNKGYRDRIILDNGARGEAETLEITGGRLLANNFLGLNFLQGVFFSSTNGAITQFSDYLTIGKDFMTLTALAYAREVVAPRISISGKLNHDKNPAVGLPLPFIKSHGVWALMKTMSWDMGLEDVDFEAVTLPPLVVMTVDSEEITAIPKN